MEAIIKVEGVKKAYKKRKSKEVIQAINDVSFDVKRGEILGLLGPNGAGKTTTIKMICGLLTPDEGSITINGNDMKTQRLKALKHISAVLEGNRNLYWRLTVKENLEYFAGNRGVSRKDAAFLIQDLLHKFNLKHKENELVNRLSRGMQQKLAIAIAMSAETDVILLDEPTLGLDVETSYEVRSILQSIVKEYNRTIIISSHDMDVIQDICERTVIINNGNIVINDSVKNLLKLFEVRSYSITLGGFLSNHQLSLISHKFPHHTYKKETFQSILEIDLAKSEEIYQIIDILKMDETPVEAIDRRNVNFEQIFMKIIKGEKSNAFAQSS
ncbi:ABC transporter ATP-binding protein [Aquibacillus koreensis]|uniref:ABC transporter ATP-binding protein n=1 Tax=Aquibacillus koreensis TaxID=279446 RepID=A0A9X3WHR6_9BACI|nr:ABC transporter ATP-binding protein [Aquibacillus koreensis]MCT2535728.1 ABC transporter ATP-binding protein [Aquibacillus koreensis]MDC3419987.1 ABC transporter ATP-binding protein [Aquibacillus koreensis]